MSRSTPVPQTLRLELLPCIHPNAAGLDIGSTEIIAAIPPDRDPEPVRAFGTFTPDLTCPGGLVSRVLLRLCGQTEG